MANRLRTLVAAGVALLATAAAAQPFTAEIIRPAPLQKDVLYSQTVLWIAEAFRSAKDVIQLQDKELGTIVGNGTFDMNVGGSFFAVKMPVTYKMRIDVRDNRYRMTFSDVRLVVDGGTRAIEDSNREPNERRMREHFNQLADSLDAHLKSSKDF